MTLTETTVVNKPWFNYLRRIAAVVRGVPVVFVSWREKPWEVILAAYPEASAGKRSMGEIEVWGEAVN